MGPTVAILLEKPLEAGEFDMLQRYIADRGEIASAEAIKHGTGWKFYLHNGDCLFMIAAWNGLIAEAGGSYELSEPELMQIEAHAGFYPGARIQLDAMCKQEKDHRLLGQMTLDLLRQFCGIVDFGGILTEKQDQCEGVLFDVCDEQDCCSQMADLRFFESYFNCADFRLI